MQDIIDLRDSSVVTGVDAPTDNGKTVESVKYVNVAGVMSDSPFDGVNIVVKKYSDGNTTVKQV